jgi:hypothetical protein
MEGKSYPITEITNDGRRFVLVDSFRTKIRGVTFENDDDGFDRQQIISHCCHRGDALFLLREPNNPVGHNAILVKRIVYSDVPDKPRLAEQLGYLSHELAEKLAFRMDHFGHVLFAKILNVTCGEDGKNFGVNIQVDEYEPA